ncbi:hypothetical protein BDY24DRAFT_414924 [Mrakia frigida]|uniref:uncharacterized protein n=1 Tax=Mrakia frigida TaxID=29902 RepID=UPI003FCBEED5
MPSYCIYSFYPNSYQRPLNSYGWIKSSRRETIECLKQTDKFSLLSEISDLSTILFTLEAGGKNVELSDEEDLWRTVVEDHVSAGFTISITIKTGERGELETEGLSSTCSSSPALVTPSLLSGEKLNISVVRHSVHCYFKLERESKIFKLRFAYASHFGLPIANVGFSFKGRKLNDEEVGWEIEGMHEDAVLQYEDPMEAQ